jgi:hypothetical protein
MSPEVKLLPPELAPEELDPEEYEPPPPALILKINIRPNKP